MNNVKLGFVGCGMHGSFLQSLVRKVESLELVAVCDSDLPKAEQNAGDFGAAECYGNHRAMLAETQAEAVAVVGTPQMHVDIGIDVLESGRHLFVEKPLGVDLDDCKRLANAAERSGKVVMNGY
ncbi:MAG: Gfo/Idh/MocA family oxidoreductase, partial [bacterium]|nr:Gfo/Idh/MocA family oxidoreductase [bacterium]